MLSKIWPDEVVKIDRDRTLTLRAEALLVAMGRQANLSGLGLETIGLSFNPKGLKLDKRLRTKHANIYGAGDVTGEYQFTHAAAYEAGIVLSNALLQSPKKVDYTWLPWCTYSDPELAGLGLNEKQAKKKKIKYSIWTEEFKTNDRALALGVNSGKIKMLLDENEKPLGIQILGPGAGDLLSEWVTATNGKVNLSTLAGAVHPYPTLGEINQTVARAVLSRNLFSAKAKKGLQFFFQLRGRACGEGFED
jgi:pyruvate/2-oxoglutarate dehydrogenase complex dihydrolipoamide dehydrogenase (E3) component